LNPEVIELDNLIFESEILLWPGTAPGSEQLELIQRVVDRSTDPSIKDRALIGVSAPSIIPFFPEDGKGNGSAVLIAPGGAYERIAFDKEGYDVAKWFNSVGVTAFVLKYRLPGEGHENGYSVPLQDAQRAIRLIKSNAFRWNLKPNKIGFIGFSAGGHLASTLGTRYAEQVYPPVDEADQLDARPGFIILGYPVINLGEREARPNFEPLRKYPGDQCVDSNTPPAFIFHAHDDAGVSTEHSIKFYLALKKANVEADLHIFTAGGHGFGIRGANGPIALWTKLCQEWLSANGFIEKA
jgi:acetyl esterase/lipase